MKRGPGQAAENLLPIRLPDRPESRVLEAPEFRWQFCRLQLTKNAVDASKKQGSGGGMGGGRVGCYNSFLSCTLDLQ